MFRIFAMLIGYGFGMIQVAYIIGKMQGIDIREHGSGNSGATNALRVMGLNKGMVVFILDASKCALAFYVAYNFLDTGYPVPATVAGMYAGLGAVLGHCYPFYLKFKGGKGIACTIGLMFSLDIFMGLTIFVVGLSIIIFTRYVSLASITVMALLPVFLFLYSFALEIVLVALVISIMCIAMHRGNISRLLSGTERKIGNKEEV